MKTRQSLQRSRQGSSMEYAIWPGWRLLMQDAGIAASPVLRRAQLPGDLFSRQNVRLDSASFYRLWDAIAAESASSGSRLPTALQIANVMTTDWFDPELFAALCSSNMRGAIERISKYVKLIAPMLIKAERSLNQTTISIDFLDHTQSAPEVFLTFKLVFFVQLLRLATRTAAQPLAIGWPSVKSTSGEDLLAFKNYFNCEISNTSLATIVFANADMDRPFLTENHKMWLFFEPSLRQRLAELEKSASMAERVRSTLLEGLPAGEVSMESVSKKLAVSSRTLQRKLHDEGASFQKILDELRRSLAHHYMRNTELSSAEISFLLGFEDPNSFSRAFQMWTGRTPQSFRVRGHELDGVT